jgi:hypothetical protein
MDRVRGMPEMRVAASEWRSDIGYLAKEFEIEAERKRAEKRRQAIKAKEMTIGQKKHFLGRLFEKRNVSR